MPLLKQVETVYLALGSNLGDRLEYLRKAIACFKSDARIDVIGLSRVYETKAIGIGLAPDFLNAVIAIKTDYSPVELLSMIHTCEKALGRIRSEEVSSRTLDIDILLYGNRRSDTLELVIPHPRMTQRAFVLMPLNDIASDLVVEGQKIHDWIKNCDTSLVTCTNLLLE